MEQTTQQTQDKQDQKIDKEAVKLIKEKNEQKKAALSEGKIIKK